MERFAVLTKLRSRDLKALRKKLDLTQAEFAGLVNVSAKTIERWESSEQTEKVNHMDYPMTGDMEKLICSVKAKTLCPDFDGQLDIAEKLCGKHLHFHFTRRDVEQLLEQEEIYSEEEKTRVLDVVMRQHQKYQYLF